jgi:adenine deaminase
MTLAFMSLLVIPELKLSDRGLFDGSRFAFTELYVEEAV